MQTADDVTRTMKRWVTTTGPALDARYLVYLGQGKQRDSPRQTFRIGIQSTYSVCRAQRDRER